MARRKTRIDKDGVRRFVPNRVVRDLLDFGRNGTHLDLNAIWVMHKRGMYTKAEMREFYQMIGYSISGYEEVFDE